jgi:hypothetical protein
MANEPTTEDLVVYDLAPTTRIPSHDYQRAGANPAWRKAAQRFAIADGCVVRYVYVAVVSVYVDTIYGRDWEGAAVRLTPVDDLAQALAAARAQGLR